MSHHHGTRVCTNTMCTYRTLNRIYHKMCEPVLALHASSPPLYGAAPFPHSVSSGPSRAVSSARALAAVAVDKENRSTSHTFNSLLLHNRRVLISSMSVLTTTLNSSYHQQGPFEGDVTVLSHRSQIQEPTCRYALALSLSHTHTHTTLDLSGGVMLVESSHGA